MTYPTTKLPDYEFTACITTFTKVDYRNSEVAVARPMSNADAVDEHNLTQTY